MKLSYQQLFLKTSFILILIISCLSTPIALQAKSTPVRFNPPPPPPDRGAPGNRGEGASRGECISSNLPLTALVPSYEQNLSLKKETSTMTQVWGLTSLEQPSFWFYVPYNQSFIQAMEFVLQTDNNKTIYRKNISIPLKSGIIGVSLKETPASLEIDKRYRWFLKVRVACNSQQTATLDYVEGWIQRVNLETAQRDRIKQATLKQKAVIYAEEGIWYDALTSLAELRLANPQDSVIAEDWKNLLTAIRLEKILTQPLVK